VADGKPVARGARGLNILVLAVGRATKGPERELAARYAERAAKAGRQAGVSRLDLREVPDGKGPRRAEAEGAEILQRRASGVLVALDERGHELTSEDFAARLGGWLEEGRAAVTFAIGGADGHPPAVREAADLSLSLSRMTLPHLLARSILLEQIYRAITIRLGHPYHRA
jgi:23S rRNA (pseudouridine1915-N3)-methyltransferase